jgi:hypothetical protein
MKQIIFIGIVERLRGRGRGKGGRVNKSSKETVH